MGLLGESVKATEPTVGTEKEREDQSEAGGRPLSLSLLYSEQIRMWGQFLEGF